MWIPLKWITRTNGYVWFWFVGTMLSIKHGLVDAPAKWILIIRSQ